MWHLDRDGTDLSGARAAFEALRARAQRAISEADLHGVDVRQVRIRVRDEDGDVLFEGTTEEAASIEIDGRIVIHRKSPPAEGGSS